MQISEHFDSTEFSSDVLSDAILASLKVMCLSILEPVRAHFDTPITITSGVRTPIENEAAHGQPNSEHMATSDWCACDFWIPNFPTRPIFDWMRNNSSLPFHQLILEHGANGSSIVHVSWNRLKPGVRSVLEGATHNFEPYVAVDHVAFVPANPVTDIELGV